MLLEELNVGLRAVLRREELLVCGRVEGRCLDVWRSQRGLAEYYMPSEAAMDGAAATWRLNAWVANIPLQTRSMVLT